MVATEENFSIPVDVDHGSAAGGTLRLSDMRWVLRRGWMLPVVGALLGLALASTLLLFVPEVYRSSARILLDRSVNRYLQSSKIVDEPTFDDTDIGSQIYVLSSDSVIVPVIRSMNLTHDPEFVGRPNAQAGLFKKISTFLKSSVADIQQKLMGSGEAESDSISDEKSDPTSKIDPNTVLERTAVEEFLKNLSVYREDAPNVINITFASRNPVKAANIANALAQEYITAIEQRKLKSNKMISQLLEDRLLEIKKQADDADHALQNFLVAHNLAGIAADRAPQLSADGTPDVAPPRDALITRLRSQYVDLAVKANELESQLGPTHLAVVKLRNQMAQLEASIKAEDRRNNLPESDQAKLRELESSASTLHSLYNSSLRKFSEINQVQPEIEDAHIITTATPPLHRNHKKSFLIMGGGLVFGFLAGIGAAVAREWVAGVFRTPAQVRQLTGIYCTVLPSAAVPRKSGCMSTYVLDAPYTRFTETIRNVRAIVRVDQRENGSKIIGIVSSVSGEGKTTVATNLAALLNASPNARALIIDCDLHRRSVTAELAPEAKEGLLEALANPSRLADLVVRLERSRVDVLPCAISERNPNAAELLGSSQMEQLLNAAREKYNFIIVEIPPIMSVVDIKMIERFVDSFVFLVEWGKTKRNLVEEALTEVESIRDRILCILLNKADPAALRAIEAYKGPRVGDYYVG
jgi:succinoglycan biosynthesis transport protein ExoP